MFFSVSPFRKNSEHHPTQSQRERERERERERFSKRERERERMSSSEWSTTTIQGRCFRTKTCWNLRNARRRGNDAESKESKFTFEDEEEMDTSIKETVYFPSSLVKFLIGRKGKTKNRLERETNCKIHVTREKNDEVTISAPDENAFESCKTSLDVILENAKRLSSFTHFISIPLNDNVISKNMNKWKRKVLRKCNEFDESVFVLSERFHLTLFMLKLFSQKDVNTVASILDRVVSEIEQFDLKIGGLEIMNDDPSSADVVYMNAFEINTETKLHRCMLRLHEELEKAGFVSREDKEQQRNYLCDGTYSPKIHATVINSKYSRKNKKEKKVALDVRDLLKMEKHCTLGQAQVSGLHLSKLSEFDRETKYYLCCHLAKLKIPSTKIDDDENDDRGFWTE